MIYYLGLFNAVPAHTHSIAIYTVIKKKRIIAFKIFLERYIPEIDYINLLKDS